MLVKMLCEMCGKHPGNFEAIVEGSVLKVCKSCSKFGSVINIQTPEPIQRVTKKIIVEEEHEIVISNAASLVKQAREKLNLEQKELAKRISEKESLIHNIESGNFTPSIKTAKKLERFLKLKLIETYREPEKKKDINLEDSSLTIGDLIKSES